MTGSQQVGRPATDDTITTRQGQYLHETHIADREECPIQRASLPRRRRSDRFNSV